jgi:hypothetical protein
VARPTIFAKNDLERMYSVEKLSTVKIAALMGCTPTAVLYALRRHGIRVRSRSEAGGTRKGYKWSPEQRRKLEAARRTPEFRAARAAEKMGEKSPLWRGGITDKETCRLQGFEWRERRKECYARDNWTCQDCGVKCRNEVRIQAHHVIARRLGGGDELENLLTLCASCHQKRERRYSDALIA